MNHSKITGIVVYILLLFFVQSCASAELPPPSATAVIVVTSTNLPTLTSTPEATTTLSLTQTPSPTTMTFDLEGGGTYEMPRFDTAQEALTFIAQHARWHTGESGFERMTAHTDWLKITPESTAFFEPIHRISGWQPKKGLTLPPSGEQFFTLNIDEIGHGTILLFESMEAKFVLIYVAMEEKAFEESLGSYDIDKLTECVQAGGTIASCQELPVDIFTPTAQP